MKTPINTLHDDLLHPVLKGKTTDEYLTRLGISISRTKETEPVTNIRMGETDTIWGFKHIPDATAFIQFLVHNGIPHGIPHPSIGARYPIHVAVIKNVSDLEKPELTRRQPIAGDVKKDIINPIPRVDRTYYTPETLEKALELTSELKNVMVRAQDYNLAGSIRDIERHFLDKQEADKKRLI